MINPPGSAQDWFQDTINKYPRLEHVIQQILGTVDLQQVAQSTAGFLAARLLTYSLDRRPSLLRSWLCCSPCFSYSGIAKMHCGRYDGWCF
jgi:hypothetical protein